MLKIAHRGFLFFILLCRLQPLFAQNNHERLIELAREALKANHFESSIDYCKQAETSGPDDVRIAYLLAENYRYTFRYEEAEQRYQYVLSSDSMSFPLALFHLALTKKMNNKYAEAADLFIRFIHSSSAAQMADGDSYIAQARTEEAGCRIAIDRSSVAFRQFDLTNLPEPVNTQFNDYAAFPYLDDSTIVITSGREEARGKKEDAGFNEDHTDCFRFIRSNNKWNPFQAGDYFEKTNDTFHEGAGSFNKDYTKYYFTQCANSDCAICLTEKKNGKWQEMIKLNENINPAGTESKHPFISITGDTLFFVSNRPGGFGMNDIYMAVREGGEHWGTAVNLGERINTKLNEASPYYFSKEKIFCFSSQGHPGYGGLDIFTVRNVFTNPDVKNIGRPFNSAADDFYFVFGSKTGYMSSNRPGGKGKFDIYSFNVQANESVIAILESEEHDLAVAPQRAREVVGTIDTYQSEFSESTISGTLTDITSGEAQKNVNVELVDDEGTVIKTTTTDEAGFFRYTRVDPTHHYQVVLGDRQSPPIRKRNLVVAALKTEGYKEESLSPIDLTALNPGRDVYITGRLGDRKISKALKDIEVILVDANGNVAGTCRTDSNGNFSYAKIPSQGKYRVVINRATLKPDSLVVEVNNLKKEEYQEQKLGVVNLTKMSLVGNAYIRARLIDRKTGKPMKEQDLHLVDTNGKIIGTATTDSDGFFMYRKIPMDKSYSVTMSAAPEQFRKRLVTVTNLKTDQYEEDVLGTVDMAKMPLRTNKSYITGTLLDEATGKALEATPVLLCDDNGNIIETAKTNATGTFVFSKMPSNGKYHVVVNKHQVALSANHIVGLTGLRIEDYEKSEQLSFMNAFDLKDFNHVSISGSLRDHATGEALKEIEVLLTDEKGNVMEVTSTNENGDFRYVKIPAHQSYKVTARHASSIATGLNEVKITDLKVEGFVEESMARGSECIYFDFDSDALRPEAKKTLAELSVFCEGHSEVQIEINAFTDCLGPDEYNKDLSLRRGTVVYHYMIESGVNQTSLMVRANGKERPIATNETADGRQLNRRVEFIMHGAEGYIPSTETYIIEPKMTLYSLAKKYNTTVEELKKLNGLVSDHIEAHRPLRVPVRKQLGQASSVSTLSTSAAPSIRTHRVKKGDTIFSIVHSYGMTVERFREINDLTVDFILPGQEVKVEYRN